MKKHLILLHGALGSSAQFHAFQNLLSPDFHVHTFNFEGHGGRPLEGSFGMDTFVANLDQYMAENSIKQAVVFGYSMGGYVALKMAVQHPEKIERILTLGTKFDWSEVSTAKEVKMLNPDVIEEKVPRYAAHLKETHHPNDWKVLLRQTADMMLSLSQGDQLKKEELAQIQTPVKIFVGEMDKMVRKDFSEDVSKVLPNASFAVLPQTPHPFQKVDIEMLLKEITSFL